MNVIIAWWFVIESVEISCVGRSAQPRARPAALVKEREGGKEEVVPVFATFVFAHQACGRPRCWAKLPPQHLIEIRLNCQSSTYSDFSGNRRKYAWEFELL